MITQIVGMQQIVITVVFLSCLIGLLLFLRMKGSFIRANLHKGQRIHVVEETAVSPTERLRLIAIDKHEFVMLSGKGFQPSLLPLSLTVPQTSNLPFDPLVTRNDNPSDQVSSQEPSSDQTPLELKNEFSRHSDKVDDEPQPHEIGPQEIADFAAKFKGWRNN